MRRRGLPVSEHGCSSGGTESNLLSLACSLSKRPLLIQQKRNATRIRRILVKQYISEVLLMVCGQLAMAGHHEGGLINSAPTGYYILESDKDLIGRDCKEADHWSGAINFGITSADTYAHLSSVFTMVSNTAVGSTQVSPESLRVVVSQ